MNTRQIASNVIRLAAAAVVAVSTASCGGELLRSGRAPVYLVIEELASTGEGDNFLSDVASSTGSVTNDVGRATISAELKDQRAAATTPLQSVTITRYRVSFRRADGRNTPGVDVPFGFDGAVTKTIAAGGTEDIIFDIVRHANKLEPPLRNLRGLGGQLVISTVAEVTFFGRDQNGNEVSVTGIMDVTFGDFPDGA